MSDLKGAFAVRIRRFAPLMLAVLIGGLMAAPPLYFRWFSGAYQGIDMLPSDAEEAYVAQIRDVLDGHLLLVNPYLLDAKNASFIQLPLSPLVTAGFARLIGQQAVTADLVAKFVFPFFITLLAYLFFHDLVKRRSLALLLTAFVMLVPASAYFLNPQGWPSFFLQGNFSGAEYQALTFARPVNPQVSGMVFISALLLVWRALFRNEDLAKRRKWTIAATLALGLSFYTYLFTYAMLYAMLGMLWVIFALRRQWQSVARVTLMALGGLMIGAPGLFHVWTLSGDPAFVRVGQVFGIIPSRTFVLGRVLPLVFIAALLSARPWKRRSPDHPDPLDAWQVFGLAFAGGAFLCLNQQIIIGLTAPVPSHYHWYFVLPYGGAFVLGAVFLWLERGIPRAALRTAIASVLLLFVIAAALYQRQTYLAHNKIFVVRQRYADVLQWLDRNETRTRTIFAEDETVSYLIPVYTKHDVYYHRDINGYLVDESRILHPLFVLMSLDGVTAKDVDAYVRDHRDAFGSRLYGQYYRSLNGCYGCFPDEVLSRIAEAYRAFLMQDVLAALRAYPVDLVVWDKQKNPAWALNRLFTNPLYDRDGILVYDAHASSSAP